MQTQTHKEWLDNEYSQWISALQASTVYNFKEHPMVKRMLSEVDPELFRNVIPLSYLVWSIDKIGLNDPNLVSGVCLRMVHYALMVLDQNPPSIIEIGGGVGQFYAVLRALGYQGNYTLMDLPEVMDFQHRYLAAVEAITGLPLPLTKKFSYDFCVSFYALGEFDDATKAWYVKNVVKKCPHGLILWNPHSGASPDVLFRCTVQDEDPPTSPGNKQLTW